MCGRLDASNETQSTLKSPTEKSPNTGKSIICHPESHSLEEVVRRRKLVALRRQMRANEGANRYAIGSRPVCRRRA